MDGQKNSNRCGRSLCVSHEEAPFDTVRCPFFEGSPLFPGARIAERTHLQWCVRDPKKSVIGYFRPREEN
jgi:hypothetical protein